MTDHPQRRRAGRLDCFLQKKSILITLPFRMKSSDIIDRTTNGDFDGSIITLLQCRGSCTDVMDVCINVCQGIKKLSLKRAEGLEGQKKG